MPKDLRGAEVEKYKLTPEQMSFQMRFKRIQDIREVLQQKSVNLKAMLDQHKEEWNTLGEILNTLNLPEESLRELPGMNFAKEEEEGAGEGQAQGRPGFDQPWQVGY